MFKRFYTSDIEVYRDGASPDNIKADVQPYSGDMPQRDYGYAVNEKLKIYCGKNEAIRLGAEIGFNGVKYMIERIMEDEFGISAIMTRIGRLRKEKSSA